MSGAPRCSAAIGAALARLDRAAALRAVVHRDDARALADAEALDARLAAGAARGPLTGVPLLVKDNIDAAGWPTTCASRLLAGHVAHEDATAVARLRAAGAIVVGKTNCDEFGMGASTERSIFGATRNPWDAACVAGGSSGGSAAAVAAGLVPLALGSDTGGSVRQPAALCGVVGLKPTWGRVSRRGLVAFASSLDQIGPLAATVRDAALALAAMAGPDPRDATASRAPLPDLGASLAAGPAGLRVGRVGPLSPRVPPDARVAAALDAAAAAFARAGVRVAPAAAPDWDAALGAYHVLAAAEAATNLARFDGVRYGARVDPGAGFAAMVEATRGAGFGAEVKRRLVLGTYALSAGQRDAWYARAQGARAAVRAALDAALATCDVLLLPAAPGPAFARGALLDDPLAMCDADVYTVPASLGGHPALALPAPRRAGELPCGVQLVARRFDEAGLVRAAAVLEAAGFAALPWAA